VKRLTGRVSLVLGDDVNTDLIYPGSYLKLSDPAEMARHALEGVPEAAGVAIAPGDILVAGRNFGCGSSRTQSVLCLKACGIQAVVAASFARSFFRSSINQGLPAVVCPEASRIRVGESIAIDFAARTFRAPSAELSIEPYPAFLMEIIERGGLVNLGREILRGTFRLDPS
jgi:3-isopropylmalate/(R)-2-methylmalate dehydratase small subunit